MAKIIKNNSGTTKSYYGISIPDTSTYEIHPLEVGGFQEDQSLIDDLNAEVTAMIDSSEPAVEYTGFPGVDYLLKDVQQVKIEAAEQTGFVHPIPCTCNDFYSSTNFDDATRTFTISPNNGGYLFYIDNVKYKKTEPLTFVIDDIEGLWFFYFLKDGTLTGTQTPWTYKDQCWIAYILWDATNKKHIVLGEERHGCVMDWSTHQRLHRVVGTSKENEGLEPINIPIDPDGSVDSDAQLGITDGYIHDEDIIMNIKHADVPSIPFEQVLNPIAHLPGFYLEGTGQWRKLDATAFPTAHDSPNTIRYNYYDEVSETWSLVNASENYHVVSWLIYTNNRYEPVAYIVGQRQDETLIESINNNKLDELQFPNLPFQEHIFHKKLVFHTNTAYANTPKAYLEAVANAAIEIETNDRYNVILWYTGNAGTNKYLDFFPGISSIDAPFVVPEFSYVRTVTVHASSPTNATLSFFEISDLVNPLFEISLIGTSYYKQNYTIFLAPEMEIVARVTSGSFNKPTVRIWVQTSL